MRTSPRKADITIVMLTAKGQASDIKAGKEVGADGYFVKPFSPTALIKKVDQVIGGG